MTRLWINDKEIEADFIGIDCSVDKPFSVAKHGHFQCDQSIDFEVTITPEWIEQFPFVVEENR